MFEISGKLKGLSDNLCKEAGHAVHHAVLHDSRPAD
jgi:hypothetical protein